MGIISGYLAHHPYEFFYPGPGQPRPSGASGSVVYERARPRNHRGEATLIHHPEVILCSGQYLEASVARRLACGQAEGIGHFLELPSSDLGHLTLSKFILI